MSVPDQQRAFVTVVSGLPRSGTSLMMQILQAGGVPLLVDNVRTADVDNPRGYCEFEPVKKTTEDPSWLKTAPGRAVKMVYRLLYDLPEGYMYYVVLMRRRLAEVLASQRKMLARQEMTEEHIGDDEQMGRLLDRQLRECESWIRRQHNFQSLNVDYNWLVCDPLPQLKRVKDFLNGGLDMGAMCHVVEPSLYRNRSSVIPGPS